jgi:hypothetical protein
MAALPAASKKGDYVAVYLVSKGELLIHKRSDKGAVGAISTPGTILPKDSDDYKDIGIKALKNDADITFDKSLLQPFSVDTDATTGKNTVLLFGKTKKKIEANGPTANFSKKKIDNVFDLSTIPSATNIKGRHAWVNIDRLETWLNDPANAAYKNDDFVQALGKLKPLIKSSPPATPPAAAPPPPPPPAPATPPSMPPSAPPSAPPAAAATGPSEDTIKKGIMSLHNLKGSVDSTTDEDLVDEIRKFLQISNCAQLFGAVSDNGDISSKVEDYSNIFQIYFELTNQEEDENTWKKIDTQYEKIIAKYYELWESLSIQRGGIRPGLKATNIFNTSANTINANNIQKIDDKIRKLLSELQRNKEYIDRLYSSGTLPTPAMIKKIEEETTRIETSAKTLITDREKLVAEEGPESMFKNLLNKFKTEAQLISWLEKAKIENIEMTAKYKAANQKFKSLSTIKKTVDKYIENMKKTLNSKCQLIQDYSRLVDNAKPLESIQQNILELHALRLDPARGTNSIQLLLEKLQITPNKFIEKLLFIKDLIAKTAPATAPITAPATAPPTAPGGGARFTADGDVCRKVRALIENTAIINNLGQTIKQKKSITEKELAPAMSYTGTTYEELKECIDEINRDLPPSDQISMPPPPPVRGPSVFKKAASNIFSVGSDAANLGKNAARIAATGVATGAKAAASGIATGVAIGAKAAVSGVTAAATGIATGTKTAATGVASGVTAAATGIATGTKTATGKIVKGLSTTESYRNFKTLEEEMSLFFSIDDPYINKIKEIFEKYTSDTDMTPDQLYRILTSNDVIAGGGLHGGAPIIIPGGIAVIWQKIIVKYIIIATMIKEKSWKPITDEIFRKKQESEKLLSEINDRIEEVKEREQVPVDNSTYFNLYKTTMKEEEETLKSEVAKIEAETVILLKKVPEEIAKIKEAAKVTFQQPNNNQNNNQDFKNLNLEQLKARKREYEAKIKLITDKGLNVSKSERKELERYKGQIPNLDKLITQKQQGTTPAAPGGGKRVYAHSTRRHIR